MASRDGNGWVRCALGHRHWGRFGAAGLLAYVPDGPVLSQRRTWWSHHGGTWGLPGGARDSHESAIAAALREAAEECGVPADAARPTGIFTDDHGGWSYTTVLAQATAPFAVQSDDDETDEVAWVSVPDVTKLELHPGFAAYWPQLRTELSPLTIIVDGANVVGSRPDGWWRDRAGAAIRLRDQLVPLARDGITSLPGGPGLRETLAGPVPVAATESAAAGDAAGVFTTGPAGAAPAAGTGSVAGTGSAAGGESPAVWMRWLPEVVLVVEGAARPAADNDGASWAGLRVVAAPGSGDDTIAAQAAGTSGRRIVVTADRELRQRCLSAGADVAGPGWLLGML
ncbi:MAG TPA: NUDIX hydrolase [Streptosporangiaceae bacterium]|jgi:8-oxo-dGTP pyrophosphatase MutT (NUDIX family)